MFVGNNPDLVMPGKAAVYSNLTELSFDKIVAADEYQGLLSIINEEQEVFLFSMKNAETVALWLDEILARLDPNKIIRHLKFSYLNMRTEKRMMSLLKVLKRCRLFVLCSRKAGVTPVMNLASNNLLYAFAYTEKEKIPESFKKKFQVNEMSGEDLIAFLKKFKEPGGISFRLLLEPE